MFENMSEQQARKKILKEVAEYAEKFHSSKPYEKGDKINYSGRIYDRKEMTLLVDSALKFWLTSGEYTDKFEKGLAEYLGVKYCSVVNLSLIHI